MKTLQYKALCEGSMGGDIVDKLLESDPDRANEITKNVCAQIPLQLAQEMEAIGSMLDLNKREIITLAVDDFLHRARRTLNQFDAMPKGDL